ncbi:hypothetical protein B0H63DRAFT_528382 [Podospora didyma]|uniref:Ankyrin repeat protein n=1 Tax=Podospora didyma TaxID=330526 RepID=A0AAE0K725_9PEZI|nr:hypothetical protein B0H63DRAFT_528382 [Podospora didyma]
MIEAGADLDKVFIEAPDQFLDLIASNCHTVNYALCEGLRPREISCVMALFSSLQCGSQEARVLAYQRPFERYHECTKTSFFNELTKFFTQLLKAGKSYINSRSSEGQTPATSVFTSVLDYNLPFITPDGFDKTIDYHHLLLQPYFENRPDVFEMLFSLGADPLALNKVGNTLFELALSCRDFASCFVIARHDKTANTRQTLAQYWSLDEFVGAFIDYLVPINGHWIGDRPPLVCQEGLKLFAHMGLTTSEEIASYPRLPKLILEAVKHDDDEVLDDSHQ